MHAQLMLSVDMSAVGCLKLVHCGVSPELCCCCVQVYERAIPAVPKAERMSVVELYVSRATDFFGVAKVGAVCDSCPREAVFQHDNHI